jgi:putative heme-binding domain-containing protein
VISNPDGSVQPVATRAADEKETEFVRSRDNWFRPVNFANGPDGCLYICDMYRETIEHPWSIPEGIKKYVDLDSGNNRGRIWRVVPDGFERKPTPVFTNLTDNKIGGIAVGTGSAWKERTARRLVAERDLELPKLKPINLEKHRAVANSWQKKDWGEKRGEETQDPWHEARHLHKLDSPGKMRREWDALEERGRRLSFKTQLAEMIGKTGDRPTIQLVLNDIVAAGVSKESTALLSALGDGLRATKLSLAKVDSENRLSEIFGAAWQIAADSEANATQRAESLGLLRFDGVDRTTSLFHKIIAERSAPDSLRQLAIRNASQRSGELETLLVDEWHEFSPALRTTALEAFASNATRATVLLSAVESGQIPAADIPANTAELLRSHRDAKVKAIAAKVLPAPEIIDRATIVERYQAALKLQGDIDRGKAAFIKGTCITCHKTPDGQGMVVGPDLATFKTAGADSILKNLFDPNAEVAPQYQAFSFDLHNGEAALGIIAQEDATQVTIRMPGGLEKTFPRKEVAGMKGLGRSLMPEGLEAALTEQDVADLLAYIAAAE